MQKLAKLVSLLFLLVAQLTAQDMTTIVVAGNQADDSKITWADNDGPVTFGVSNLFVRLDDGTLVDCSFTCEFDSSMEMTRVMIAEDIAGHIRYLLMQKGASSEEANRICTARGGNSVHVDNTDPADQPDGGGTPDEHIDQPILDSKGKPKDKFPINISKFID